MITEKFVRIIEFSKLPPSEGYVLIKNLFCSKEYDIVISYIEDYISRHIKSQDECVDIILHRGEGKYSYYVRKADYYKYFMSSKKIKGGIENGRNNRRNKNSA